MKSFYARKKCVNRYRRYRRNTSIMKIEEMIDIKREILTVLVKMYTPDVIGSMNHMNNHLMIRIILIREDTKPYMIEEIIDLGDGQT